ncbi:MAG: hypothetical protein QG635_880 [Bacteroidota bacterium]|nr:hypothetical protein [Bacteroidota bacterium]
MKPEQDILFDIKEFFKDKFTVKVNKKGYKYAYYDIKWLLEIGLTEDSQEESKTANTVKSLQKFLVNKYKNRIKAEAKVAEGMTLRFNSDNFDIENIEIDTTKLMAFDLLDIENGCAFEISLADAFAEFFKDVLKALLDSRVKKLYLCMRNHNYHGSGKSGFIKVASSNMIKQYIQLARLYKLEIILIDIFPRCNE